VKAFVRRWLLPPGVHALASRLRHGREKPRQLGAEERGLLESARGLRDRHAGQRCFILGAGPSVGRQDLRKLAGETVISVSNTFVHRDFALFRPRYHAVPHILSSHAKYYPVEKFVTWLREMEARTGAAEMFFDIGDRPLIADHDLFKGRIVHWVSYCPWNGDPETPVDPAKVPSIWSVSELAITLAVYMGFERIYLLGIDHDWFNGLMRHFYDASTDHKVQPTVAAVGHVDAEFQMRRHADIFRKYKYLYGLKKNIYNANADPDHYMDVFPKADYDSLFPPAAR
jgi:hypothetical protein